MLLTKIFNLALALLITFSAIDSSQMFSSKVHPKWERDNSPLDNCPRDNYPQLIAPRTIPPPDNYPTCQLPPRQLPPGQLPPTPIAPRTIIPQTITARTIVPCANSPQTVPPAIQLQIPLRQVGKLSEL